MFGRRPTFNMNRDVRRARSIGSPGNRTIARFKGRSDGKIHLYGPDTTAPEFREHCQWLRKQQQRAAEIQTHANRTAAEGIKRCDSARDEQEKELEIIDQRIATLAADSENINSRLPTSTLRSAIVFFTLMFLFEFFFSAVSLSTSGLGAMGFELAIAIIAAAALVWLSEIVGKALRQLPLSHRTETADHYKHYIQITLCCIALGLILTGVNFLRSLASQSDTTPGVANQLMHWALFAVGLGLVLVGIFKSSDHEYSGPRYGLARLQRRRQNAQSSISYYTATSHRLAEFPAHLEKIAESSVQKVFSIYSDQYRRASFKTARELNRA
jgi:hypothetical protein